MDFRRIIPGLFLMLFLGFGLASGLFFWQKHEEYERLKQVEASYEKRLGEMEAQLHRQQITLERLRSDRDYVAKQLRKNGYIKPGEYILRFGE